MIDETTNSQWNAAEASTTTSATENSTPETAGFCQDCGKRLNAETVRRVGTGVFCEPCLQVRLAGGIPGRASAAASAAAAMPAGTGVPPIPGEPSPALAGLLGFIPGVGAMYNGQYAKGFAHMIIFVVLCSLSDHVSGMFGVLVFGWVLYQVFDAVHTARARRDGLPLPDMFGLNDIGERLGYGRNWTAPAPVRPAASAAPPAAAPAPPSAAPVAPTAEWTSVAPPPVAVPVVPPVPTQANWAGYVPPTAFGGPVGYTNVPLPTPTPVIPPCSRFPVAAVVLIAFGCLFLAANFLHSFFVSPRWISTLVIAIFAAWTLYRRIANLEQLRTNAAITGHSYIVAVLRLPVTLATLAIIMTLWNLDIATVGQTWPLILIVLGGLALVDRATSAPPADPAMFSNTVPPVSGAAPSADQNRPEVRG